MKKKLNTDAIKSELAGSVFFPPRQATEPAIQEPESYQEPPTSLTHTNSMLASEKASSNASKHASMLAEKIDLDVVRKTLKFIGKEVLYVRLTQEEKNHVADIEYTYLRQGIKTSSNEIGRIALNFLLADYKANGEQSILAKILIELHT